MLRWSPSICNLQKQSTYYLILDFFKENQTLQIFQE